MTSRAYISLGSNIGNRFKFLQTAINELNNEPGITVVKQSSIYETDPVGYEDQALFLNMVLKLSTNLTPLNLLEVCLKIEQQIGRTRELRWGPRKIDIDILLYDDKIINSHKLVVPHPRMIERNFVIIPLLELDENIILPTMNEPLRLFFSNQNNHKGVRKWKQNNGDGGSEPSEN